MDRPTLLSETGDKSIVEVRKYSTIHGTAQFNAPDGDGDLIAFWAHVTQSRAGEKENLTFD